MLPPKIQMTRSQWIALAASIWIGMSVGFIAVSIMDKHFFTTPLNERIQTVEKGLKHLKDLETYLKKMKKDMVATEAEINRINKEYLESEELKKLTDQQMRAMQKVLHRKTLRETLWDYFLGFVLGVAASIIGAVIYEKYKQQKMQKVLNEQSDAGMES